MDDHLVAGVTSSPEFCHSFMVTASHRDELLAGEPQDARLFIHNLADIRYNPIFRSSSKILTSSDKGGVEFCS